MRIGPTEIIDTFAEAFGVRYTRLIITAADDYWLDIALAEVTGYGTSVLGCDAEAGVERRLSPEESPDGRPAATVLLFAFTAEKVSEAAQHRVAQCILTCPTTACFNGLAYLGESLRHSETTDPKSQPNVTETYPLGKYLRYFGDGYEERRDGSLEQEASITSDSRLSAPDARLWHIPVMDGEFIVEEAAGVAKGVAGGNIILQGVSQGVALKSARRAAEAISVLPGVIAPFPGGVCRSGSKVGSRYKKLIASTAEAYCPTLRDRVQTELVRGANCAYEVVVDGIDEIAVAAAMKVAIDAAVGEGVLAIGAGNYGGKLGKFPIKLHELFA